MSRFLATAILLSSGLASGCLGNDGPEPAEQIYAASLALWNEEGPTSYDMVLRRQTISAAPDLRVIITVRNEVVTSRIYFGTDIPVSPSDAAGWPEVRGLFAIVRDAMDGSPFLLATEYDDLYGYPSSIVLDVTAASTNDNVTYTVEEFTPVAP